MKRIILAICILCICVSAYSAIKDQSIFEKVINLLSLSRNSAVSTEATLKNSGNTISSLLISHPNIITGDDKTNLTTINTKINTVLTNLNDLISTIDTLYPEIK